MTARLYLTVYAKDNLPTETAHVVSKSLGTVDAALSDLQFRDELHGTGGIVARINRHHPQAALFVEDRYVLAHSDFGVIGGAFLREGTIDLSSDDGPGGEFMVWTGPGPMAILSNAVMDYDSNIFGGHNPIDGYWDLSAQGALAGNDNGHPIPMLKRALVEAQLQAPNAIGVVDHSSWSYALDSAAAVPPTWTGSYGVNVGDDLLTIVGQFDQLGGVFFRMSHFFKLDAYLSYGTDKSGAFGAGTVRFEKGVNVAAAIDRKVRGSVHVTHLIVGGAERTFTTAVDPTYALGQVIRYGFLSVPETSDTSSLQEAGLAHIAARKRQTDAWTFPLHDHGNTPASGIYEPGNHYKVGDTVSLHTGTGEYDANEQAAPVAAIEWRLKTGREANGDYWVIPEIGSTFHWGGTGSFQGRDAPGSQHRFLLCEPGVINEFEAIESLGANASADGASYTAGVVGGPNAERVELVLSRAVAAGQSIVVIVGHAHNADAANGVWDDAGNTYSLAADHRKAISGDQPRVLIYYTNVTASLAVGESIYWEVDVGSSLIASLETDSKYIGAYLFSGALSSPVESGIGSGVTSTPSVTVGAGDLIVAGLITKAANAGTVVEDVDWTAFDDAKSMATQSFVLGTGGFRIADLSGETWSGTLDSAHDWATVGAVFTAASASSVNDGHPDLVGTGSRAKRCGDKTHVKRDRAPTANDDWATQGMRLMTVWHQLDDLVTPTEIVGSWVLFDNSEGAAVWLAFGGGTDDQTAAEVPFTPTGTIAATDTQAAVAEVATDAATALSGHTTDATDAHNASAVSFSPTGTIASTDTQAAVAEVATDAASALATHAATSHGSDLIYLPLTTVVGGVPDLVWDANNSLIPTGSAP